MRGEDDEFCSRFCTPRAACGGNRIVLAGFTLAADKAA
jgi:hypothetical protein